MGLLGPKAIYASYQFISSPVLTVLGRLKRGFLEKGEQVSVQTESEFGLRLAKVARLLEILGYTRAQTRKEVKNLCLPLLGSKTFI